ncbi:shikimate kinase [Asticcacaulis benevestitus]|uniref:Shikimate kinase n=1 Tax=Asticcacaulis benevestitus DSM 16100 = ATCC BAA-896 TaxID=1121022 RepID=V4PSL7_9CAUL|nr:shikimate kinase [Asticcacaulis benevestitus]ESQ88530.1 shikimate kinase [Asticcacaulis benevestitus DSM 16100 = ATCC BAA-896]
MTAEPEPSATDSSTRPVFILPKTVALVGLMGVGKTTIGKRLADHFGLPFVDADEEIEKAAGMTVADIFANYGEKGFRDGEQRVIARLLDGEPRILATGGGALTHPLTRERLKAKAITLWLKTDLKVLARRVANRPHRPLLKDRNPMDVLKEHVKTRYPLYEMADVTVDTGDQSHVKSLDQVLSALHAYVTGGQ